LNEECKIIKKRAQQRRIEAVTINLELFGRFWKKKEGN